MLVVRDAATPHDEPLARLNAAAGRSASWRSRCPCEGPLHGLSRATRLERAARRSTGWLVVRGCRIRCSVVRPPDNPYSARLCRDVLTRETSNSKLLDGSTEVVPPDKRATIPSTLPCESTLAVHVHHSALSGRTER